MGAIAEQESLGASGREQRTHLSTPLRDHDGPLQDYNATQTHELRSQGEPHRDPADALAPEEQGVLRRDDLDPEDADAISAIPTLRQPQETYSGGAAAKTSRPRAARRVAGVRQTVRPVPKKWRERAHIRVGTLNMNGRGAQQIGYANSKWPEINAIIRDKRLSVLAVQETHLSEEHLCDLERLYSRLLVINSAHENATSTAGIAVILNRDHIADPDRAKSWTIIPGRALMVSFEWKSQTINVLAVYAPNDKDESITMWEKIDNWLQENSAAVPTVDVLLGDMNFVEDEMDRAPVRFATVDAARSTFRDLKEKLRLTDGWRNWNPGRLEWTWRRPGTTERSRIDRIYMTEAWLEDSRDWTIEHSLSCTDHYMVIVDLTNKLCPEVGKGWWAMPNAITEDKSFIALIEPVVRTLADEVDEVRRSRTDERNIQTVMERFKTRVAELARERGKAMGSTAKREISRLNESRVRIQIDESIGEEARLAKVQDIEASIVEQQLKQARKKSDQVKTTDFVSGDDQSKYFHSLGKPHKPRETIKSLKKESAGPTQWASTSQEMAGVARDFYENLQTIDMDQDPEERNDAIDVALNHVNKHLSPDQRSEMADRVSRDLIGLALRESKSDSAPGINGIPYEFWKMLDKMFEKSKNSDNPWPDTVQILTHYFNDIEEHGVDSKTTFTKGWLCPLFKKGNKDEIANYRPITLLNTDYKIFTKAISIKLASVAPDLINKNQAGFMKGRSITDQCKLAKLMVNWGEAREMKGAIVCLDQEKAYDRIAHDYLFVTLGAYNFPESFTKTIRSLYEHAETVVILNGFHSSPFRVIRGVRQGDPLSCLLFNLAIEPLAEMIRRSNIIGFKIPGTVERLVISLFADDTCVFLSHLDDPAALKQILDKWCMASGAKFNIRKTEVIPIGPADFRERVIATRRMSPEGSTFDAGIKIATQGEAVRLLGVYIGNGIDQNGPWEPIIEAIKRTLKSWNVRTLTMSGKILVVRSIVTGKTQYLGMVQGMPQSVQDKITEVVMDFLWPDGRRKAYVSAAQLGASVEEGGRLLPDFYLAEKSRELSWLRKMCLPESERPLWVYLAEDLMKIDINPDGGGSASIPPIARVSPLLQQWHPNANKLPKDLLRMLNTAKEVGFQISAPVIPTEIKREMPVWLHIGRRASNADEGNRTSQRDDYAKCLQSKHRILTTGQAVDALKHWDLAEHSNNRRRTCTCDECDYVASLGCETPQSCYTKLLSVLNEIAPRWDPRVQQDWPSGKLSMEEAAENEANWQVKVVDGVKRHGCLRFDPSTGEGDSVVDYARIFTKSLRSRPADSDARDTVRPSASRPRELAPALPELTLTIATAVSGANGEDAECGAALVFSGIAWPAEKIKLQDEWASHECGTLSILHNTLNTLCRSTQLRIMLNNRLVLQRVSKDLEKHTVTGWSLVPRYARQYRCLVNLMRSWNARITFEDGTARVETELARDAAREALSLNRFTIPPDSDDSDFDVPGHSLKALTQNRAFKLQKHKSRIPHRQGTYINMGRTRSMLAELNGVWHTKQQVWRSLRSRDIYKPTREFLWRLMHNTQKIGNFWLRVRHREMLSECPPCEMLESMDHIMFECDAPGREAVWREAREVWARTGLNWPEMNLGTILGCSLVQFKDDKGKQRKGTARLFRILVSEAAFLIWKLRNERRIQNSDDAEKWPVEQEIIGRWRMSIERRMRIDVHWTSTRKYKRKALSWRLMRDTWNPVLRSLDGGRIPDKWWAGPELLVSIWPPRPRGRER